MRNVPVLPDWTRWAWASQVERDWWAPLVTQVSSAFHLIERYSVVHDMRKAAWQFVSVSALPELVEWAQQLGLLVIPTGTSDSTQPYSSSSRTSGGNPTSVRVIITRAEHYASILPFSHSDKIGDYLGYPACCQHAFRETWGKGHVDSTWEQVAATNGQRNLAHTLLRWMGVRLVPHMPCSYSCEASQKQALDFMELGGKLGFREEMLIANEMLRWPVKASRLFGIAELVTPALKISTRTDWTREVESFELEGDYFKPSARLWTENGFASAAGMRAAHDMMIAAVKGLQLTHGARVLDLGCGNGHLLRRLIIQRPDLHIGGVEADPNIQQPMLVGRWFTGRLESVDWSSWSPDVVFINPVRLLELSDEDRTRMLAKLATIPTLIVYAYSDCVSRDSLNALCLKAGLAGMRLLQNTPVGQVGVISK